ncbi:hypothetical protein L6452_43402 [Arctium lappa]|uniref:Uncharacterized protein n=2 Tax=Arctium lappa TaxID=4217 RepID=A0ACB8XEJ7_ARCLA|nr:hypothetical protein L6452_43397 [Arctium lappa]KAI3664794.1 hypothetical protein L6452_43402 [Arctium lappa]
MSRRKNDSLSIEHVLQSEHGNLSKNSLNSNTFLGVVDHSLASTASFGTKSDDLHSPTVEGLKNCEEHSKIIYFGNKECRLNMEDSFSFFEKFNDGNYEVISVGEENGEAVMEGIMGKMEGNNFDLSEDMERSMGKCVMNVDGFCAKRNFSNHSTMHVTTQNLNSNDVLMEQICPNDGKHIMDSISKESGGLSKWDNSFCNPSGIVDHDSSTNFSTHEPNDLLFNSEIPFFKSSGGPLEDVHPLEKLQPTSPSSLSRQKPTSASALPTNTGPPPVSMSNGTIGNDGPISSASGPNKDNSSLFLSDGSPDGRGILPKPTFNDGLPSILGKPPSSPIPGKSSNSLFRNPHLSADVNFPSPNVAVTETLLLKSNVDTDGFQTVTRKSSVRAHASSSNDQVEQQKKDNYPAVASGKLANDKKKSKSKVPSRKEYRPDPGSSSFSSPIHMASSEPMDTAFEQDDLLDEEDVIEVESDDGATARFLTRDPLPSQVDLVPTPESERMDSTPSFVSK